MKPASHHSVVLAGSLHSTSVLPDVQATRLSLTYLGDVLSSSYALQLDGTVYVRGIYKDTVSPNGMVLHSENCVFHQFTTVAEAGYNRNKKANLQHYLK